MAKHTIFFSHSSKDKVPLAKLRDLFVSKTSSTVEVFMSSDGQSIPLGRNWVHRVEEGLKDAKIMIVFVTPNSLGSNWIYFEAGYANSRGIRVIPVAMFGIDMTTVRPPLGLLQGYNAHNYEGLNNLIAIVNKEFEYKHLESFTAADFDEVSNLAREGGGVENGRLPDSLEEITVRFHLQSGVSFQACHEVIDEAKVTAAKTEKAVRFPGVRITCPDQSWVVISISPYCFEKQLPLLGRIMEALSGKGFEDKALQFRFPKDFEITKQDHRLTGLMDGTGLSYAEGEGYLCRGLTFAVGIEEFHNYSIRGNVYNTLRGAAFVEVSPGKNVIPVGDLYFLLNALVERMVIRPPSNLISIA